MDFLTDIFLIIVFICLIFFLINNPQKIIWFDELFNQQISSTGQKLKLLRGIGYLLLVAMLYVVFINLINQNFDNVIKALTPLGVLISALLASFSVISNIENTNTNMKKQTYLEKLEAISKELKELFSQIDYDTVANLKLDVKSLGHLNLMFTIYAPSLLTEYQKLEDSIGGLRTSLRIETMPQNVYIKKADPKDINYEVQRLKVICSELQEKTMQEMQHYL